MVKTKTNLKQNLIQLAYYFSTALSQM